MAALLVATRARAGDDSVAGGPPRGALAAAVSGGAPSSAVAPAAGGQKSDHWALQPLRRPPLPPVRDAAWAAAPVDRFILARLEESGLEPAPEADRATLIRRLSFDLLGLPPAPEEVEGFAADPSTGAYERLVDRLLASPRHGERWARHWLDVARYTESQGFEYDRLRPNAWHYRDYVIRSFNEDKPYDRFLREQIAGDALEPHRPEGLIAASFLVCGPWDEAGSAIQTNATQRAITREEEMEDLVSVVAQTFLGLTVNCARCHSHKFDPIPQEDYYRFKAVFEGVRHGERSIASPEEAQARAGRVAKLEAAISSLSGQAAEIDARAREAVLARRRLDSRPGPPLPLARWTFEGGPADALGSMHGELKGGAVVKGGRLILDGKSGFLRTAPLPREVGEKTLEAWLVLPTLAQGGGGVITIEDPGGQVFDSIVFGERQARKWEAGSNGFVRTRELAAPPEAGGPGDLLHLAVSYGPGGRITVYRNGRPYGEPYTPPGPLPAYRAGEARVLLGLRHTGGARPFLQAEIEEAALHDRALTAGEVAASCRSSASLVTAEDLLSTLGEAERSRRDDLLSKIGRLREELAALPALPVSYCGTRVKPEPTRRLVRGDVKSPAEEVAPGALSAIAEPSPHFSLPADASEAERRLRLADWLADPRNPLPARVMANRIWHYHFGSGLVATPNDFGKAGAAPSHPELLDWLAVELVEGGFSVKRLHRLIVTSSTYRQSSRSGERAAALDADNTLRWRFSPRRLEAEEARDAMLAVSGELNLEMGGPSFRPFEVQSFNSDFYQEKTVGGPAFDRRTIYRMNVNSGKSPLLDILDCPDPSVKTPARRVTTTPLQALALMNDPFVLRQAGKLAGRVLAESGGDLPRAVELVFRRSLGRSPSPGELGEALREAREHGIANVCWVVLNTSEFLHVE